MANGKQQATPYQVGVALMTAVNEQGVLERRWTQGHLEWLMKKGAAEWVIVPGTCGNRDEMSITQRVDAVQAVAEVNGMQAERMLVDVSGHTLEQSVENAQAVLAAMSGNHPQFLLLPLKSGTPDQHIKYYVDFCRRVTEMGYDPDRKVLVYDLAVLKRGFPLEHYPRLVEATEGRVRGCKRSDNNQMPLLRLLSKFPGHIFTTGYETSLPWAYPVGRCTVGIANCLPTVTRLAATAETVQERQSYGYIISQVLAAIFELGGVGDEWQLGFKYLVAKLTPFSDYPVFSPSAAGKTLSARGREILDDMIAANNLLQYADK